MSNDAEDDAAEVTPSNAARLLSVLLVTPGDDLLGYRKRMLGKQSTVSQERLSTMRGLLTRLGEVLLRGDDVHWEQVEATSDQLAMGLASDEHPAEVGAAPPSTGAQPPRADAFVGGGMGAAGAVPVTPRSDPAPPAISSGPAPVPPAPVSSRPPRGASAPSVWASKSPAAPSPVVATPPSPAPPEAAPPASVGRPEPPPPVAAPERSAGARPSIDETAVSGTPLPFSGSAEPPPQAADQVEVDQTGHEVKIELGGTMGVDQMISPFVSGALPFGKEKGGAPASERPLPELTLEQYASLCASCAEQPHLIAKTHASFGLPVPAMRDRIDQQFKQKFDADEALKAKFDGLVEQYRDWIRRNPSS